ncbi:TolC family protein [Maritalea sp. S77]|uniref:TolC family protein n=1 Tax=Maritalea sp. S77 TaxID=3415125 RepID=UPI003C79D939
MLAGCASKPRTAPCLNSGKTVCDQPVNLTDADSEQYVNDQRVEHQPLEQLAAQSAKRGKKISLQQVALVALQTNPTIDIARWQKRDAQAGVGITAAKFRPKVEYNIASGPEVTYDTKTEIGEDHTRSEIGLTLSQLLFDFGKTNAELDWSKALVSSADWRFKDKVESTLYEVSDIYLTVLELDLLLQNSYANQAAHKETYRLVKLNADAGNATQADVQKAFTRLENSKTQSIELASQRQRNESEFKRLTGIVPGNLTMPDWRKHDPKFQLGQTETYVRRNPRLRSILVDMESLRKQQEALQRSYLPQITLEGSTSIKQNILGENPVRGDAKAQIVLRGSLYDGGDRSAKIDQINARIGETEARYRQARRDLERDIRDAARILRTAKDRQRSIHQRINASEDVVRLYREQFKAGNRTIFELLDAQQELFTAKAEQITNQFDILRAKYAGHQLSGTLGPTLLGDLDI